MSVLDLYLRPWTQHEIDRLDDLVALDRHSFSEIARIMGRSRNSVTSQWARIVKAMGAQAI